MAHHRPLTIDDYTGEQLRYVSRTLLHLATHFGDLVDEEKIVVVGGLVPSLLVPSESLPDGVQPHSGTMEQGPTVQFLYAGQALSLC